MRYNGNKDTPWEWISDKMPIIKKVTKLKNLGIYTSFNWDASLQELKQYNVIYGWNGTGKSTFSKLLGALNEGSHPDFPSLEYQIHDSDGSTHTHGTAFGTPIRVFNTDFIADNIDFDTLSSKSITVVLGKENKAALKAIEEDEAELARIKEAIRTKTSEKEAKEKERGLEFTAVAKVIGAVSRGGVVRTYNKTHAEQAFARLSDKELLDDTELEKLVLSVAQPSLPEQKQMSLGEASTDLSEIIDEAHTLLAKTVSASVIERLKENADISEWVEAGIKVHADHESNTCEFCGNPLDTARLAELTAHFNEADAKLKVEVDDLANRLVTVYNTIKDINPVDKMNLYQEFHGDYAEKAEGLTSERDALLESIKKFGDLARSKKLHTTEELSIAETPDLTKITTSLGEVNEIIANHNKKTSDFVNQQKNDSAKIENHHLSGIYDKVNGLKGQIEVLDTEIAVLKNGDEKVTGQAELLSRVATNKSKVSSEHKACELLNTSLKKFLGHDEITFAPNTESGDDAGYLLLRRGDPAKSLSEGERTAIAFVFFVTQLQDDSFDPKTGIIVVDDPVSSLDSNSQYQAFSFLKKATEDASQLFILTHNFDFLKLVTNWIKHSRKTFGLFMVKNSFSETDGTRTAYLDKLDKALEEFESEYHYLFNVAYKYKDDGTIANAYKMPNIARKLLDSFLMFRVPKNTNTFNRLQEISYDEEKKASIYKFANDQSHITGSGFDPSLVPEAKNCITDLLDMMKAVDPDHFRYLEETVS